MTDWKIKTLEQWDTINQMATRRFGASPIAEEAALSVMDGLQADNWKKVRGFQGKSKFKNYIRALTFGMLEDFSRKRYGRLRPPGWVLRLGGYWRKLFEMLCMQRSSVADTVETLRLQTEMQASEIENAAYQLLEKIPDCGRYQNLEVNYSDDELLESEPGKSWERSQEKREKSHILRVIYETILGKEKTYSPGFVECYGGFQVELSPEERLLIKLCFLEQMTVTEAGRYLGLTRFQVHGRMRRLLSRIKEELDRVGMGEELRLLLRDD